MVLVKPPITAVARKEKRSFEICSGNENDVAWKQGACSEAENAPFPGLEFTGKGNTAGHRLGSHDEQIVFLCGSG